MIQQTKPLPSFESARSRLLLEESCRAQDSALPTSSFVAQGPPTAATVSTATAVQPEGRSGRARGWGEAEVVGMVVAADNKLNTQRKSCLNTLIALAQSSLPLICMGLLLHSIGPSPYRQHPAPIPRMPAPNRMGLQSTSSPSG